MDKIEFERLLTMNALSLINFELENPWNLSEKISLFSLYFRFSFNNKKGQLRRKIIIFRPYHNVRAIKLLPGRNWNLMNNRWPGLNSGNKTSMGGGQFVLKLSAI